MRGFDISTKINHQRGPITPTSKHRAITVINRCLDVTNAMRLYSTRTSLPHWITWSDTSPLASSYCACDCRLGLPPRIAFVVDRQYELGFTSAPWTVFQDPIPRFLIIAHRDLDINGYEPPWDEPEGADFCAATTHCNMLDGPFVLTELPDTYYQNVFSFSTCLLQVWQCWPLC